MLKYLLAFILQGKKQETGIFLEGDSLFQCCWDQWDAAAISEENLDISSNRNFM